MLNFQEYAQTAVNGLEADKGDDFTPVFMSSLLQAPLIEKLFATKPFDQMTLRNGKILRPGELRPEPICAIITANGRADSWKTVQAPGKMSAREKLFEKAGVSKEGIKANLFEVFGLEPKAGKEEGSLEDESLLFAAIRDGTSLTPEMKNDLVKVCEDALVKHPTIRCFLFECTELPPYADDVRKKCKLPVFDLITLANFFYDAQAPRPDYDVSSRTRSKTS